MKKYLMFIIAAIGSTMAFAQNEIIFTNGAEVVIPESNASIFDFYQEGGILYMSLITLCLVGTLLAAWKLPSRVKELGATALVIGCIALMAGLYQMFDVLLKIGDVSPAVICGGLKVTIIAPIWGCIVYLVSLIVRIIQKPKTI